jgi:hypothetical protein
MDTKLIKSISSQVYQRFPEMAGHHPKVTKQPTSQAKSISVISKYLLTYKGTVQAQNGKSIPRMVRVVADSNGKILKITTSR